MTPTIHLLGDSIRLSHLKTDRFKTGVLTFALTLPLTRENIARNQLLPSLLRRGTDRYPNMASINRRLDELYASCVEIRSSRMGKNLALIFSAEILDPLYIPDKTDVTDGVIEVIAQMLLRPKKSPSGFDGDTVAQEIRFATDSIRAEVNNTRGYSLIRLAELMRREDRDFPTLEESISDLEALDGASLSSYHETLLASSPLEVFYVGSLSPEEISHRILCHFGSWKTSTDRSLNPPSAEASAGYAEKTLPLPVSQGKLAMGFRTGVCATDPRYPTMLVLNELFGGSAASKLFLHVREELSLCYFCSSAYNKNLGILSVSAGIENERREVAVKAILSQMEDIRQGKITEAEWTGAKTSLLNAYRQSLDNPFELQAFYSHRILFGIHGTLEDAMNAIREVSREDVIALAAEILCDTVFFIEGTRMDGDTEEEADDEL